MDVQTLKRCLNFSFAFFSIAHITSQTPTMIDIMGGSVLMGCTTEQEASYTCNTFEHPVHQVTVFPMQLAKYEVMQSEWAALVPERSADDEFCIGATRPACNVSFYDALTYCNRLSVRQGLQPCYFRDTAYTRIFDTLAGSETMQFAIPVYWDVTADGYRLPTESEWEYAARAGENNFVFAGSNTVGHVAWYTANSVIPFGCRAVGTKNANAWGIYDLSGNVWEWTWDNSFFYPSIPVVNSIGPPGSWQNQRSARGGSYVSFSESVRVATRGADNPGLREGVTGFRVAQGSLIVNCTDTLIEPLPESIGANPCGAIRWKSSNFAVTGYKIAIGTSPGASDVIADHIVQDTFYYPDPVLPVGDTLYIRIIPFTNSFTAQGCMEFWFVTADTAPQNPLEIAPPDQPFICEYIQELTLSGDFSNVDSVKWSTGDSTPAITISETGIYNVQVYFEGCRQSLSTEIKQGKKPVPNPNLTLIYPSLAGQATGAIDITVKDGVPPYQFTWKQAFPPFAMISNEEDVDSLEAGRYEVYILDHVGCGKNWFYSFTIDSVTVSTPIVTTPLDFVYPVPASDRLYLVNLRPVMDFIVYDASGQRQLSGKTENNSIHIAALPEGFYILLIRKGLDRWWSCKFTISR